MARFPKSKGVRRRFTRVLASFFTTECERVGIILEYARKHIQDIVKVMRENPHDEHTQRYASAAIYYLLRYTETEDDDVRNELLQSGAQELLKSAIENLKIFEKIDEDGTELDQISTTTWKDDIVVLALRALSDNDEEIGDPRLPNGNWPADAYHQDLRRRYHPDHNFALTLPKSKFVKCREEGFPDIASGSDPEEEGGEA